MWQFRVKSLATLKEKFFLRERQKLTVEREIVEGLKFRVIVSKFFE